MCVWNYDFMPSCIFIVIKLKIISIVVLVRNLSYNLQEIIPYTIGFDNFKK